MTTERLKPFLRQYTDDALGVVAALQEHQETLHEALHSDDRELALRAHGPLGESYRLLGRLDRAIEHSEQALALAVELGDRKAQASNLIRLATAYQYANRHADAEPLFAEARPLTRELGFLEDFALQHHGKCLAEQGRWEEAIACFEQALALRQRRGDAALIASSEEALAVARRRSAR